MKKLITSLVLAGTLFAVVPLAVAPAPVHAVSWNDYFNFDPARANLPGSSNASPRDIVLNVIKTALAWLALVAVAFIIYGGIMWITAAGNDDRLKKAKEIISAAVIGLVIVLLSYIIVSAVVRLTVEGVSGVSI